MLGRSIQDLVDETIINLQTQLVSKKKKICTRAETAEIIESCIAKAFKQIKPPEEKKKLYTAFVELLNSDTFVYLYTDLHTCLEEIGSVKLLLRILNLIHSGNGKKNLLGQLNEALAHPTLTMMAIQQSLVMKLAALNEENKKYNQILKVIGIIIPWTVLITLVICLFVIAISIMLPLEIISSTHHRLLNIVTGWQYNEKLKNYKNSVTSQVKTDVLNIHKRALILQGEDIDINTATASEEGLLHIIADIRERNGVSMEQKNYNTIKQGLRNRIEGFTDMAIKAQLSGASKLTLESQALYETLTTALPAAKYNLLSIVLIKSAQFLAAIVLLSTSVPIQIVNNVAGAVILTVVGVCALIQIASFQLAKTSLYLLDLVHHKISGLISHFKTNTKSHDSTIAKGYITGSYSQMQGELVTDSDATIKSTVEVVEDRVITSPPLFPRYTHHDINQATLRDNPIVNDKFILSTQPHGPS